MFALEINRDVAVVFTGLFCSRIQLFSLSRHGSRETHFPPRVRVRSFSETAVCYAAKDGTTKDSGSDGGKVSSWKIHVLVALSHWSINTQCYTWNRY